MVFNHQLLLQTQEVSPNLYTLIEYILLSGGALHRFVDSLDVSWPEVAAKLGVSEKVCRSQMQLILDAIFNRCEFTEEDRELLCRLVESETLEQAALAALPKSDDATASHVPRPSEVSEALEASEASEVPEDMLVAIVQYLQNRHFPSYSASLIAREYTTMKKLYTQFKSSNKDAS